MQNYQLLQNVSPSAQYSRSDVDPSFLALNPSLLLSASTLVEPLQDRQQTASAFKIWQIDKLALGGLHQPLGKWLVLGPKLRQVGPFTLIWIPTHCGAEPEKDSVFILVSKVVTT
jgi:hypothetical protein